ncbi:MAG: hypothetical protein Ct9H90mP2_14940 [Dehalococcoidia bacterium]|nr:MAG: hypothetical protein Ct9H90mP2_14940 [Dehalococcoidia bacterium]
MYFYDFPSNKFLFTLKTKVDKINAYGNKIFICDDDKIITDSLSEYLSAMDYEILAVNDGNEAIENFLSYNPDLVLLDIMMPRLNGLDVIKISEKNHRYLLYFLRKSYT